MKHWIPLLVVVLLATACSRTEQVAAGNSPRDSTPLADVPDRSNPPLADGGVDATSDFNQADATAKTDSSPPVPGWAVSASGPYVRAADIVVDDAGHVFVMGTFGVIASFGSTDLSCPSPGMCLFLAKLDSSGNWLWAVSSDTTDVLDLSPDGAGGAHVMGRFGSGAAASFGSNILSCPQGKKCLFTASADNSGSWQSAVVTPYPPSAEFYAGVIDSAGDSYLAGSANTTSFGATTLSCADSNKRCGLVARLDGTGKWAWAVSAIGSYVRSADHHPSGGAIFTGSYHVATFGSKTVSCPSVSDCVFVAWLDSTGDWGWAASAAASKEAIGYAVSVDSVGASHVIGSFRKEAFFGSTTLTCSAHENESCGFVAKLDGDGSWQWAVVESGDDLLSIAVDGNGSSYVAGIADGPVIFGSTLLDTSWDAIVAKLDGAGSWSWVAQGFALPSLPGDYADRVEPYIAADSAGNCYIASHFYGTVGLGEATLLSNESTDVFVWKIDKSF